MSGGELRFDGRVAIVTGAGRGMGRSHARLLAARGAKIVVNDLPDAPVADVVGEIEEAGGAAVAATDDISEDTSARALVERALEAFGRVDILVNNAAVIRLSQFHDLTPVAFERTMRVNAYGPYYTTRAAWPHMSEQSYGRIVMISSAAGLFGIPDRVDYAASKAAVVGMTRALASEADGLGITVNAIFPSAITRMSSAPQKQVYAERFGLSEHELIEKTPHLVSVMAAWLCHEESTANGEIFEAGGGDYRRILIASTPGYRDHDPTLESIRDHLAEIVDSQGVEPRPAFRTRAEWPTDDLVQPPLEENASAGSAA